jgi:Cu(I)/Ag(I) efflux system membrane fusion protein
VIYTIADLSRVWVLLDAYESDLAWIRYGQEVEFTTEAHPGDTFRGRVTFIDPMLDAATRTVKVRVNVDNAGLRLKPEMFVRGVVHAEGAADGRVMDPEMSGKWICPMHPEVVENGPGKCRECGMDLVSAESLGYASVEGAEPALLVPASAVLVTGRRAVVYVRVPGADRPTFEGREVVLGPRAGDDYIVESGLREGDRVVTNGAFKIDSALQIQARPSMMSPSGGMAPTGHAGPGEAPTGARNEPEPPAAPGAPREFTESLSAVYEAYFAAQAALAGDDLPAAREGFARLADAPSQARMDLLSGEAHHLWMRTADGLRRAAEAGADAADIETARTAFAEISDAAIGLAQRFGHPGEAAHYWIHCPMAFGNTGADWLQKTEEVANPYFGAMMPRCGTVEERIGPDGASPAPRVGGR